MKVTGKDSISGYIKILLQLIFIFGTTVVIFLPFVTHYYIKFLRLDLQIYYTSVLVLLYLSGIPALAIIYQFIKLFDSLKKETPFIQENVKYLKRASYCAFVISLEYIAGIYVFHSIFALIITGIFAIAWLGLYILAELFKQAIQFKEENELTI